LRARFLGQIIEKAWLFPLLWERWSVGDSGGACCVGGDLMSDAVWGSRSVNIRWKIGMFSGALLTCAAAFATVVILHTQDYCISQGRFVTDKEMYVAALKANYSPYRIEMLQDIELVDANGNRSGLIRSGKQYGVSTLPKRIDQLAENPAFLKTCCKRTRPFEGGDYDPPTFWQVFVGMSARSVDIIRTTIVVAPQSLSPPPYKKSSGGSWMTDVDILDVVGPIITTRKNNTRGYVTVCGENFPHQDNDIGF
jgi:hypothetical protein